MYTKNAATLQDQLDISNHVIRITLLWSRDEVREEVIRVYRKELDNMLLRYASNWDDFHEVYPDDAKELRELIVIGELYRECEEH